MYLTLFLSTITGSAEVVRAESITGMVKVILESVTDIMFAGSIF